MKKGFFQNLRPLVGVVLFVFSAFILYHQLRRYHFHDVLEALSALRQKKLLLALGLTFLNYLALSGYEILGFRYINRPFQYRKVAFVAFIAYALSNNIGLSAIFGASSRYHLYSALDLSVSEIANLVIFSTLTFFIGLFIVAGVIFVMEPMAIPKILHLPIASAHPLGVLFISLIILYLLWATFVRKTIKIWRWEFPAPSAGLSILQIMISSLDWILAGSVLYVLLPHAHEISFVTFLGAFLLAQLIGLVSQAPGGLGVFEAVLLILLSPKFPTPQLAAALLLYRAVYYLLPLVIATILLGVREILFKQEKIKEFSTLIGNWFPGLVPQVLAFNSFVGGAILLFSGAMPSASARLAWLKNIIPLPLIELSHFLGSLTGMLLLLLARGLQRRLDAAYFLTIFLLSGGIIFSLLKGFDYEEATILFIMLAALFPSRHYFYRKASLTGESFTFTWTMAIFIIVVASAWIGFFSYKHIEYSSNLWWRFALSEDAPRFLRANVGIIAGALFFAVARLLQPAAIKVIRPSQTEIEQARGIVKKSKSTTANLALLGDKMFLFSDSGQSFIMYGIRGRSWVALGDPVGLDSEKRDLVWRFRELCDRYGVWTVFWHAGKEKLDLYLDLGLTVLKIGEEARIPLSDFTLEGTARKELRQTFQRLGEEGCTFEIIPSEKTAERLPELKTISDEWLARKRTREKGFSLGFFKEDYLKKFPIAIAKKEGRVVAFANVWLSAEKEEISLDLMRHSEQAPRSVMDYLFVHLMLWGNKEGYRWFNLGVAPLAGLENRAVAPLWNRVGYLIFGHGEYFYNFQGVRNFKDKFGPIWESKYLISPGGLALPKIFADIASLNSQGLKGIFTK